MFNSLKEGLLSITFFQTIDSSPVSFYPIVTRYFDNQKRIVDLKH